VAEISPDIDQSQASVLTADIAVAHLHHRANDLSKLRHSALCGQKLASAERACQWLTIVYDVGDRRASPQSADRSVHALQESDRARFGQLTRPMHSQPGPQPVLGSIPRLPVQTHAGRAQLDTPANGHYTPALLEQVSQNEGDSAKLEAPALVLPPVVKASQYPDDLPGW
jgi:hypothetical protein